MKEVAKPRVILWDSRRAAILSATMLCWHPDLAATAAAAATALRREMPSVTNARIKAPSDVMCLMQLRHGFSRSDSWRGAVAGNPCGHGAWQVVRCSHSSQGTGQGLDQDVHIIFSLTPAVHLMSQALCCSVVLAIFLLYIQGIGNITRFQGYTLNAYIACAQDSIIMPQTRFQVILLNNRSSVLITSVAFLCESEPFFSQTCCRTDSNTVQIRKSWPQISIYWTLTRQKFTHRYV